IPLSYSAQGKAQGEPLIAVQEQNSPWIMDINNFLGGQPQPTDTSLKTALYKLAEKAVKDKASAVLFYNSTGSSPDLHFDPGEKLGPLSIPVLYVRGPAAQKYFKDSTASVNVQLQVSFSEKTDTLYNVIAHIDHHAPGTIIIGAHDIGDKAALIELARLLKGGRRYQKMNYLFITFPDGKNGQLASRYFTEHPTIDLKKVNCVIDMDGTGKVSPQSPGLQIAGTDSSPGWPVILNKVKDKKLRVYPHAVDTSALLYDRKLPFLSLSADSTGAINDSGLLTVVKYMGDLLRELNGTGKLASNP
ncbi:MAG TPA: M28 family peptidase, partial [Chitinophagaceae bacterium]|nr:M28 family peptidase [Chitinophagaceae bacterium]